MNKWRSQPVATKLGILLVDTNKSVGKHTLRELLKCIRREEETVSIIRTTAYKYVEDSVEDVGDEQVVNPSVCSNLIISHAI